MAIVGIGCRYPGVAGPPDLWRMLIEGRCAVGDVPESRWDREGVFDAEKPIPRRGAFLDDVRSFDAQFFKIAPREAEQMDPQQRIMLEVSWEALEDAGRNPHDLAGSRTGVYLGFIWHDYEIIHSRSGAAHTPHSAAGQAVDLLSSRVSYALGLRGPSLSLNTGCSGSMVALHLACQALRAGECDVALVGGTNMMLAPEVMCALTRFGGLAPDGVSKAFSAAANGFGRGEGVGVVVLRPLAAALADGDRVYCAIRATGVNNDGGGTQLTAPSLDGQRQLLHDVYGRSGIDPASVQYVEAHGTGTPVGDPVEARALGEVLGSGRAPDRPLRIGSIKTNIGHQEGGAGVAGLIKAALSLHHGRIPPSLHSQPPNPAIDFDGLGLQVQTETSGWDRDQADLPIAAVSSFGWGGTNAHAILQAAPATGARHRAPARPDRVLLVSAASGASLQHRAGDLAAVLEQDPGSFDAVCANLAARRAHLPHRLALVGEDSRVVAAALRRFAERGELPEQADGERPAGATGVAPAAARKVVFVFPGQGSQWLAMGRALIEEEPVFAAAARRCGEALREFVDWSLEDVLTSPAESAWLERVDVIQCALWAMQVSLAELWRSWGIEPHAVVGHSMGEVAAACVAGAISPRDGARIMATRSRLAKRRSGAGGMLHVALSAEQAAELVRGRESLVSVAVCSSPRATVLSGDPATLHQIEQQLTERDIYCAAVRVDYASHSPQMDGLLDELRELLAPVTPSAGSVPMISTALARPVQGEELTADYWARNLRQTVRFADVIQALAREEHEVFLEVSPHPILVSSIEENLQAAGVEGKAAGSLRREQGHRADLLVRLCDLYTGGADIRWRASDLVPDAHVIDLPRYPWDRDQYWLAAGAATMASRPGGRHALVRGAVPVATRGRLTAVMARLALSETPFLQEHVVQDTVVFPAAGHIDLVLAAASEAYPDREWSIEEMRLESALTLEADEARAVQVLLDESNTDLIRFTVASAPEGDEAAGWTHHVRGRLTAASDRAAQSGDRVALEPMAVPAYYDALRAGGLDYGPLFRGITALSAGPGRAEGTVEAPEQLLAQLAMYRVHPALLDSALQLALAAAPAQEGAPTRIPVRIASARLYRPWPETVRVVARARVAELEPDAMMLDVAVSDADGRLVMHVDGVELAAVAGRDERDSSDELMLESVWRAAELPAVEPAAATWAILDFSGRGAELARAIEETGRSTGLAVHRRGGGREEHGNSWRADFSEREIARDWLAQLAAKEAPLRGVVLLGGSAGSPNGSPDWSLAEELVVVLARMTEAMAGLEVTPRPRLVLVTSGAQGAGCSRPEWASVWGAGRVVEFEHPEVACTRIDLDDPGSLAELAREIAACESGGESEIAHRAGERFVSRLERGVWSEERTLAAGRQTRTSATTYKVETVAPGSLDNLTTCAATAGPLADDHIRVEVHHASINFMDHLTAMGICPGLEPTNVDLGQECSGRIAAIGRSVATELAVGDEVVVINSHSLQSHVDVRPADLVRKPAGLSMQQAASYPVVFMTAWYALHHLARVRPGERILIHSGAGGLGLAAIQIARRAGMEIFATAGSEHRRHYLRGLGEEHVFDSRSATFASELMSRTGGEGVDVVLNSLTGELIEAGLSCLRFGGRFLEVGKRDIYSESRLSLQHFRKSIGFFAIDPRALRAERPDYF
ncbi:MAG TPA: acyltransferase domain-containing protein, partial [Kofleriaceae bacterium]|nr:acyltransferase domain-containing protein [Kofleriaceae bacterium]